MELIRLVCWVVVNPMETSASSEPGLSVSFQVGISSLDTSRDAREEKAFTFWCCFAEWQLFLGRFSWEAVENVIKWNEIFSQA